MTNDLFNDKPNETIGMNNPRSSNRLGGQPAMPSKMSIAPAGNAEQAKGEDLTQKAMMDTGKLGLRMAKPYIKDAIKDLLNNSNNPASNTPVDPIDITDVPNYEVPTDAVDGADYVNDATDMGSAVHEASSLSDTAEGINAGYGAVEAMGAANAGTEGANAMASGVETAEAATTAAEAADAATVAEGATAVGEGVSVGMSAVPWAAIAMGLRNYVIGPLLDDQFGGNTNSGEDIAGGLNLFNDNLKGDRLSEWGIFANSGGMLGALPYIDRSVDDSSIIPFDDCTLFSYCFGNRSKQVRYAKIFCYRFLSSGTLLGYYNVANLTVKMSEKYGFGSKAVTPFADMFFDFMLYKLGKKNAVSLKARVISRVLLSTFSIVNKLFSKQFYPKKTCIPFIENRPFEGVY